MLFLILKAPKDMHQFIVPMLFSLQESHASGAEFPHPDRNREEMCGMMDNLVADRRRRKGPTVTTRGSHLSRLPTARGEEELTNLGAHTLYLNMPEMADRMCGSYRKTAKWFTSREARLMADYLDEPRGSPRLPNNM